MAQISALFRRGYLHRLLVCLPILPDMETAKKTSRSLLVFELWLLRAIFVNVS